jgi:excisionase family DNA binding protein
MDRMLTTAQAASELGVHERTVRRYMSLGLLAYRRLPGGHYRISQKAVEDLWRANDGSGRSASRPSRGRASRQAGEEAVSAATLSAQYYDHPGVILTASAGDCGYRERACGGEGVSFPASSPSTVAVGGTILRETEGTWSSGVWPETGGGCSSVFAAPVWQSTISGWAATGCGTSRLVADVSTVGAPETGVSIYDSTPVSPDEQAEGWGVDGGTSVATPIVAGEFALDGGAHGVPYPAQTLYSHVGDAHALYDVITGANGMCAGTAACEARAGYDGPSGLGTPIGLTAFSVIGSPTNMSPPLVTGDPERGQVLSESHGEWPGGPVSFAPQWARCDASGTNCQPIPTATGTTYTVKDDDVESTIRVQEIASNRSGEGAPAISSQTRVVKRGTASIRGVTPHAGITGSSIAIHGSPMSGATDVRIGEKVASFSIISPKELHAIVPDGVRAGQIIVTTPLGALVGPRFVPTFSICSFAPQAGAPGTHVTLRGTGFNKTTTVRIGGTVAAAPVVISSTRLRVEVPSGASTGVISVTNSHAPVGSVRSATEFVVP